MGLTKTIWTTPQDYLRSEQPSDPMLLFSPPALQRMARRFVDGFPGLVTYAVKSNPDEMVIQNLDAAGITGYDVASVNEIELIRRTAPTAALHFNNPVRSRVEIERAVELGVRSFSVDSFSELQKLIDLTPIADTEVSVRFKLPVAGAAYDFGSKFGANPDLAADLLRQAGAAGFQPSLTFHPGTQCTDPTAWQSYIQTAADIARKAGVQISRLNTGGGFPSHRLTHETPDLERIFAVIDQATQQAFGAQRPVLVCEPGRAMVAETFSLLTQVRAVRDDRDVFLNDGVYGGLAEHLVIGSVDRFETLTRTGTRHRGLGADRVIFGPTCDSIDRLPGTLALPSDMEEGDYLMFHGMGAYSSATVTRFNGFGKLGIATVMSLTN